MPEETPLAPLEAVTTNEEREAVVRAVWPGPMSITYLVNRAAFVNEVDRDLPSPTFSDTERRAVLAELARIKAART